MKIKANDNLQIISYLTLRKFIGLLGIALPVIMVAGGMLTTKSFMVEQSISNYYHTGMRDIFVGILFVLGFFLLSYKGYQAIDDISGNLGFVFAIGVALCPTGPEHPVMHALHAIFATLLFAIFIFFSLYLFRKGSKPDSTTSRKKSRNIVYLVCGIVMIISVSGVGICLTFLSLTQLENTNIVFWLESVALWAFGISWLTKGKVLWEDVVSNTK